MKLPRVLLFAALLAAMGISVYAQKVPAPTPTPRPEPSQSDDVIRISSNLVLVDALVVDKDNRQVKDLTADDFQVFQDGKRQEITSFSYVDGAQKRMTVQQKRADGQELEPPPVKLNDSSLGRVITFVIDDGNCQATINGTASARDGVKRFIAEQMRPDDKVAIYQTRSGSSLLQMYTSNKEVLRRAVNKIRWMPTRCSSAFDTARDTSTLKINGGGATSFESEADKETKKLISDKEKERAIIGSLGVLGFVVDRLRSLPQRKIVFYVSEGIDTSSSQSAYDALRDVADKASRAQVVVYTVPTKGVTIPGFMSAEDEVLPGITAGPDQTVALAEDRRSEERALNEGMGYLSYATGGKFLRNQNFINEAVEKVLETETGYYLIGYEPDDETFDGKKYHLIQVRLNRPDLKLTSRKGFIGRDDEAAKPVYKNPENPVYEAIASPFSDSSLDLKMTPLVKESGKKGGLVRMLFHIDGRDLTFTSDGDLDKVVLNVVLVALDEKGKVAKEFNRSYPIRFPARAVPTIRENGLDYSTDVEIPGSGIFSLRLAVMDEASRKLGSAGDFIEIPKDPEKEPQISSLVVTGFDRDNRPVIPKPRPVASGFAPVFDQSIPSLRRFRSGAEMAFLFDIHGMKKSGGGLPVHLALFREGQKVKEWGGIRVAPVAGESETRIGSIVLPDNLDPGDYVLQVIVADTNAKQNASSWIDFEVVD